jgi:malate/lactate dehydrogenase
MAVASDKVVIVGTGNVGATAAYAMMLRGLFTDIVLIDASSGRAAAEAISCATCAIRMLIAVAALAALLGHTLRG